MVTIPERKLSGGEKFLLNPQMLTESHRPMFYRQYMLEEVAVLLDKNSSFEVFFNKEIEEILSQNTTNRKPIIRIKIDYTGF